MLDRLLWLALCASASAIVALARVLTPSAEGFGTHTQLGLPPCALLTLTSLPCPACGLTTSFAFMARLDVVSALRANAAGVPLFILTLLAVPLGAWASLRRLTLSDTCIRLHLDRVALVLLSLAFVQWIARVTFALVR